jgi:hypothetical protein
MVQLYMVNNILHFPIVRYCREAYLPVFLACLPVILCMVLTSWIQIDSPLWHFTRLVVILLAVVCAVYFLGLQRAEREKVLSNIRGRFLRV